MRHLAGRLIMVVFTLIIGISANALWLMRRSPDIDQSIVKNVMAETPVTCCELTQNPELYYSNIIRVRAALLGYHELALYDPACKGIDKYVRADFDSASRKKLATGIADLNGAGFKDGNFWAEVVLLGRFEIINEPVLNRNKPESQRVDHRYIKYRSRLVLDVEQVGAVASALSWPP
jgi:hypothetical protein